MAQASTGEVVLERVMGFIHQSGTTNGAVSKFVSVEHAHGEFRATSNHLVTSLTTGDTKSAEDKVVGALRVGDIISIASSAGPVAAPVIAVRADATQHALVAPLTSSGTLLVDQLVASAYASAGGVSLQHSAMHAAFYLLRVPAHLRLGSWAMALLPFTRIGHTNGPLNVASL
eukprot:TRINITY_DN2976_c0_g1_i16.p4 TRINITY_DN2976_c0_g1~~TRINITY_DN2976_c0_g1_i16.p4  ORF type:complete len:173 (+),score=22.86 TRINITY_DN2976_c0_g1_i16:1198-1716(+)